MKPPLQLISNNMLTFLSFSHLLSDLDFNTSQDALCKTRILEHLLKILLLYRLLR